MPTILVLVIVLLLSSLMALHIYNENNLSKRIERAGAIVQELLDQNGIRHIDLEKKFEKSSFSTQIRVIEYYLHTLNSSYKDFGSRKSVFQRIRTIENALVEYGYQDKLSLI